MISLILGSRERERRYRAFTEFEGSSQRRARYRIPDICVKALPHEVTPILIRPDLAIEIVSPDDSVPEMLTKIGDYLAAGIPHIWVIDPYSGADQAGIRRPAGLTLATPLVGEIDFAPSFEQLAKPAE